MESFVRNFSHSANYQEIVTKDYCRMQIGQLTRKIIQQIYNRLTKDSIQFPYSLWLNLYR